MEFQHRKVPLSPKKRKNTQINVTESLNFSLESFYYSYTLAGDIGLSRLVKVNPLKIGRRLFVFTRPTSEGSGVY